MSDARQDTDDDRSVLPVPQEPDDGEGHSAVEDDPKPPSRWSVPLSAQQASVVAVVVLLPGLALLSGPVVGDGPDPDPPAILWMDPCRSNRFSVVAFGTDSTLRRGTPPVRE